jgi:hypothetical protein
MDHLALDLLEVMSEAASSNPQECVIPEWKETADVATSFGFPCLPRSLQCQILVNIMPTKV